MLVQVTLGGKVIKKKLKVKCEICGKGFERIAGAHLKTHGITFDEYKEQFPDASLMTESCRKKMSKAHLGKTPTPKVIEGYKKQGKLISGEKHPMYGRTGDKHPFFGKHHTEETKHKQSDAHSGEKSHMYGKHLSDETKQKLSESHSGKHHTEETKEKMRKTHNGIFKGENNSNWQGGISFEPYCEKFDDDLKERVRNFFNRCCYVCGKNETDNGRKLDVHHVNYDKMVCCNDVKPLFVPLCRGCHSKTHGDREYWEEFFTVSLNYLTDGECFIPKKCITEEKGGK